MTAPAYFPRAEWAGFLVDSRFSGAGRCWPAPRPMPLTPTLGEAEGTAIRSAGMPASPSGNQTMRRLIRAAFRRAGRCFLAGVFALLPVIITAAVIAWVA